MMYHHAGSLWRCTSQGKDEEHYATAKQKKPAWGSRKGVSVRLPTVQCRETKIGIGEILKKGVLSQMLMLEVSGC